MELKQVSWETFLKQVKAKSLEGIPFFASSESQPDYRRREYFPLEFLIEKEYFKEEPTKEHSPEIVIMIEEEGTITERKIISTILYLVHPFDDIHYRLFRSAIL